MSAFWNNLWPRLVNGGLRLLGAIAIVIVEWYLIKWLEKLLKKGKLFGKVEVSVRGFLITTISVILKVVLIMTAVATLGVNMTGLITLLGSCGVAIGLALQGSLANIAGGILILICRPFRVGNYIESGSYAGTVKNISLLYTTLTTLDNKNVVIPNGSLSNATVVNYSAEDQRRVDLDFSVAADTDTERVKKVLLLLAEKHELVLENPAPFARMTSRDADGLIFTLRVWTKSENFWTVKLDLLEQVKDAFDKLEIEVPYPQMDVRMRQ